MSDMYRNGKYNNAEKTSIDCELNHETLGWIPYTSLQGGSRFNEILNCGEEIAEYTPDIETVRAAKLAELKDWVASELNAPITYDGKTYQVTDETIMDLMTSIQSVQMIGFETVNWRDIDNAINALTLADLIGLGTHIGTRKQFVLEKSWHYKDLIRTSESVEEIETLAYEL